MTNTLVLDFDGSVGGVADAQVVPLRDREEEVRFACSKGALSSLALPAGAVAFLGSGDFHHVTYALIERLRTRVEVVVFDNHPDNMRYPFGIHCGSWVSHVARLPFVERVHVAGITSRDVEGVHAIENRIRPLWCGRVVYWCVGRDLRMLHRFGARDCRSFESSSAMLDALLGSVSETPLYLSIDKDVLSRDVVATNWDQGVMGVEELADAIRALRPRVVAADVTGDVSIYSYRSRWKRLLSALDRQPAIDAATLERAQAAHARVNAEILSALR